ncbi:MAG: MBL fold metallo-hydrolase [Bacteroidales bacterium]|jgi:7,8-dihydropterin-6-yl-methyl-4-(beta-D-ribofuranosyl)aminobenzene 5'-phosphate synthase|nr:MBL fold metallo-hydrolase [Bacteroidales bacterium]
MKILVLTENNAGQLTSAEHGLSYLIETDGKRILFDTGQSDLFLKNAAIMGVSLEGIDMIVLSHGHYDHGNGLEYLNGGTLLCHPGSFIRRYRKSDHSYIGLKNSREELARKFKLITSREPLRISESIVFAGEIPRTSPFESKLTSFVLEDGTPDFVTDDSALIITLPHGLFIITGCGHAGIVNTIEHASAITGIDKIYGIMGGFHLREEDHQAIETVNYLKNKKVGHVIPSHCTSGAALARFRTTFDSRPVGTGDTLSF